MPIAAEDKALCKAGPSSGAGKPVKAKAKKSDPVLAPVLALQQQLASSADLNPLQQLIELCVKFAKSVAASDSATAKGQTASVSTSEVASTLKAVHVCIQVLQRSFLTLLEADRIPLHSSIDERGCISSEGLELKNPEELVGRWLQGRWNAYVLLLCSLLGFETASGGAAEEGIRKEVLESLVALQVEASQSLTRQTHRRAMSNEGQESELAPLWAQSPWKPLMHALIFGSTPVECLKVDSDGGVRESFSLTSGKVLQDVRQKFADDLLENFDDVRYATCRDISGVLRSPPSHVAANEQLRSNALQLLVLLTAVPVQESDLNAFLLPNLASLRKPNKGKGKVKDGDKKRKFTEDGDSDEDEEPLEDWFSDSDEESGRPQDRTKKAKVGANGNAATGLGGAAVRSQKAAKNRRRRQGLPFYQAVHSLPQQKAAFSNAWLSLLLPGLAEGGASGPIGGEISLAQTHEVLLRLHIQILPHLVKPNMLLDWLVDCVDAGGATSLLALNGLFTLMIHHNLDYPAFYTKLYALLGSAESDGVAEASVSVKTTPSVLHMRYRSRFLRLLETFLSSTHLPSALVASFAKRLSRLALRAPPAAAVTLVPFIWSLLKRHPQCMQLIHRDFSASSTLGVGVAGGSAIEIDRFSAGPAGVADPFDPRKTDPTATHAIESSLWELASFGASLAAAQNAGRDPLAVQGLGGQSHWLHSVTTLSRILAEPFTRERYDLEDFLDITYGTLFDTETAPILKPNEKRRNPPPAPVLAYSLPGSHLKGSKTYRAFVTASALARAHNLETKEGKCEASDVENQPPQNQKALAASNDPMDLWVF
ncbi:CBF-domain-containing protein [Tilletiaria anomala UBC 951]|uniref:CBF-domain-containing protein n=1 Tax=Tilletiaria anomala (strain ATCC 24038 / CBS 436.72 / UBC 951) TaxID=1037660 RepID=A0A066VTT9_TILAU|nr:CBF-domain-containing protein [Tilletiaria anomala UBC 951]KDN41975.1 CBF-domain-containing protein [Tilletiaria anomala UBC 951]